MDDVPNREESVLDWTRAKLGEWCASVAAKDDGDATIHELLTFCMMLSLEEMASVAEVSDAGYFQRGTWSLQNIKNISKTVKDAFIKRVADEGDQGTSVEILAQKYPTTLVSTMNQVLFEHQGYTRMKQFGNLECFHLSKVLDNGVSSPILMAVLYMAVAEESGMPLHALVLEEGSYVVLWPKHGDFSSCVIDPYAQGILISGEEIAELFELEMPLKPSSLQDIAHAILNQVLLTCWSQALQLPPEPAFRIPISLEVALGEYQDISYSYGGKKQDIFYTLEEHSETSRAYMARCISAAEKVHLLSPGTYESKLQLAILCYFSKDYARSIELLNDVITLIKEEEEEEQQQQQQQQDDDDSLGHSDQFDLKPEEDWWSTEKQRMKILYNKCILCSSFV